MNPARRSRRQHAASIRQQAIIGLGRRRASRSWCSGSAWPLACCRSRPNTSRTPARLRAAGHRTSASSAGCSLPATGRRRSGSGCISSASSSSRPRSSGRCSSRRDRRSTCSPTAAPTTSCLGYGASRAAGSSRSIAVHHRLAPVFAWLWVDAGHRQPVEPDEVRAWLDRRRAGFLILVPAAQIAETGVQVGMSWLFVVYLIHTIGELCLSPVGLSSMTKLAPARIVGLMMGVWFLARRSAISSVGRPRPSTSRCRCRAASASSAIRRSSPGVLMLLFRKPLTRLIGDDELSSRRANSGYL